MNCHYSHSVLVVPFHPLKQWQRISRDNSRTALSQRRVVPAKYIGCKILEWLAWSYHLRLRRHSYSVWGFIYWETIHSRLLLEYQRKRPEMDPQEQQQHCMWPSLLMNLVRPPIHGSVCTRECLFHVTRTKYCMRNSYIWEEYSQIIITVKIYSLGFPKVRSLQTISSLIDGSATYRSEAETFTPPHSHLFPLEPLVSSSHWY